jgi:fermentation-respiration switch protein FrsA (DUF1100 family)
MMAKILLLLCAAIATIWLIAVGLLWTFQEKFLFVPDTSPLGSPPHASGFRAEEVETADGLRLHFWAAPPQPGKPTILLFHGNGGNAAGRLPRVARAVGAGYGVILAEYRGYGGNPGTPSEAGFYKDAAAYMAWAGEKWSARSPIIWGESIGTGVATWVATSFPISAVVLDSPFSSLTSVAQAKYPWVPVGALLRHRFDSLSRMSKIKVPVLILHGDADLVIPIAEGRRLLAATIGPHRELFLPGVGHTALSADPSGRAMDMLMNFLAETDGATATATHPPQ